MATAHADGKYHHVQRAPFFLLIYAIASGLVVLAVAIGGGVAAYILLGRDPARARSRWSRPLAVAGTAVSAGFVLLLTIPGMPAFMARESWVALLAWLALGAAFFLARAGTYRRVPEAEMDRLILGADSGD